MIKALNNLLQVTRRGIKKVADRKALTFYYPTDSKHKCLDQDKEVIELNKIVQVLRDQELAGGICICKEEFDIIESRVYKWIPECKKGELDYTKETSPDSEAWLAKNPWCQSYETYADYLAANCQRVGLDFKIIELKCSDVDLSVEVTNLVSCEAVDLALKIEAKECNITLNPTVTLQECVVDFVTNVVPLGCDISLETYVEKISCGVSLETILTEVGCNVDLNLTAEDSDCEVPEEVIDFIIDSDSESICTYIDTVISLTDLGDDATYTFDFEDGVVVSGSGSGPYTVYFESAGERIVTVTATGAYTSVIKQVTVTVVECSFDFTEEVDDSTICYYTDATFTVTPSVNYPDAVYSWDFGSGSVPSTDEGETVTAQWTTSGSKTVTVTGTYRGVTDQHTIPMTISTCAGNIIGNVSDNLGVVASATVKLFADDNMDGISDGGAALRTVTTNGSGDYSMASLTPGNYVIVLTMPANRDAVTSSGDGSPDGDLAPDISTTDLVIPCTITPSKTDLDNNFVLHHV